MSSQSTGTLPPGLSPIGEPDTFEGCLLRTNPTESALWNLAEQVDDTPIIMLNLLRFRPRGDNTIYNMYGKVAGAEIRKLNSYVSYFGQAVNDLDPELGFDDSWDAIAMPVYHRRNAYLTLQRQSAYQLAIPYRMAGTQRRTLYALADADKIFEDTQSIAQLDQSRVSLFPEPGQVDVLQLLKFKSAEARQDFKNYIQRVLPLLAAAGETPLLSVNAETPVVSETYWEHAMLTRFPSREALINLYESEIWQQLWADLDVYLERVLRIASTAPTR